MITLFTPFCGRMWALERYFAFLEALQWNHRDIRLVFWDNSCRDDFNRRLSTFLTGPVGAEYGEKILLKHNGRAGFLMGDYRTSNEEFANFTGHARTRRARAVGEVTAAAYNRMREVASGTDAALTVEDDVEPPPDALAQLIEAKRTHGAQLATAVVWSRCHNYPFVRPKHPTRNARRGVERIRYCGFGCLLIDGAFLDRLTFRAHVHPSRRLRRPWSTDRAMWRELHDTDAIGVVNWTVRCRHWSKDGTWR